MKLVVIPSDAARPNFFSLKSQFLPTLFHTHTHREIRIEGDHECFCPQLHLSLPYSNLQGAPRPTVQPHGPLAALLYASGTSLGATERKRHMCSINVDQGVNTHGNPLSSYADTDIKHFHHPSTSPPFPFPDAMGIVVFFSTGRNVLSSIPESFGSMSL